LFIGEVVKKLPKTSLLGKIEWTSVKGSLVLPLLQVAVPRSAVGVVIGKNGEMIKKIQNETGARVQFQQGRDDNPEERMCALTGTINQIEDARQRIEELIESVLVVHLIMCFNFIRFFMIS
jgi:hypothetical protein